MTPENAMRQASMTAAFYMQNAVRDIDDLFGEGYAKENPDLVASIVEAATEDFATTASLGLLVD